CRRMVFQARVRERPDADAAAHPWRGSLARGVRLDSADRHGTEGLVRRLVEPGASAPAASYERRPRSRGHMRMKTLKLSTGDWVEVRSKEEILRTLDSQGQLDGMPFMPEMFAFCGKRFQVYKRAHKTCDTVFPVRGRRVHDAVHLETRCDGQAHGGCQAGCLIFWKEAWLRPLDGKSPHDTLARVAGRAGDVGAASAAGCGEP